MDLRGDASWSQNLDRKSTGAGGHGSPNSNEGPAISVTFIPRSLDSRTPEQLVIKAVRFACATGSLAILGVKGKTLLGEIESPCKPMN